ncbi:MAG: porin family protein [Parvularculaceae bacterium]
MAQDVESEGADFQSLKDAPGDPQVAYRFAKEAANRGDYATAIAGLERLLLLDPSLDNIRYYLGELYLQAGNFERAEGLLQLASQSETMPSDVYSRAQDTLRTLREGKRIAAAGVDGKRTRVYGRLYAGGRYDTNPRQAPTDIILNGVDSPTISLDASSMRQKDFSFETSAAATFEHRLSSTGATWFASANAYVNRHDKTPENDISVFTGESGFSVPLDGGKILLQPFLRASHILLDDDPFATNFGGGLTFGYGFQPKWRFSATLEVESEDYRSTDAAPSGDQLDGTRYTASIGVHHDIGAATRIGLTALGGVKSADVKFEAFDRYGAGAYFTHRSTAISEKLPVTYSARATYEHTAFNEPEPLVDPNRARTDDRFSLTGSMDFEVTKAISLSATVEYTDRNSNIVNFDFDNFSARVGAGLRF